jgi:transposase InsO family protein
MSVNRSGYYKWLNRDLNQYERNRNDLAVLIKEEHARHPSYGYHALAKTIRDKTGWIFSDNLCHKVCRHEGIRSKCRHYRYRKSKEEHIVYKNLMHNDWNTSGPLQKIVSDMTVIRHRGKYYEWTFFLDVYSNAIIASGISSRWGDPRPYFSCRDQLLSLLKKEGISGPVYFHTDQGTVFSSASFNQALLNHNIIRSMSRSGTPTDNPIIESMNGWIKAQIWADYRINDYDSIEEFIEQYIHYYNYERPMYKHNYKSPAEFTLSQGYKLTF